MTVCDCCLEDAITQELTDEQCAELLRDPHRWSFIIRDDAGVVCWGRGTEEDCKHGAEQMAAEAKLTNWRVQLWPPTS